MGPVALTEVTGPLRVPLMTPLRLSLVVSWAIRRPVCHERACRRRRQQFVTGQVDGQNGADEGKAREDDDPPRLLELQGTAGNHSSPGCSRRADAEAEKR